MEYLSDIELYYSTEIKNNRIILSGEEKEHAVKVMRRREGEDLYVTDGNGRIFLSRIDEITGDILRASSFKNFEYLNTNAGIYFCIPKLRNPERFEFALEKCTELGVTNFIIYNAVRGISRADRIERWEKIIISAMKQSLRSFRPTIKTIDSLSGLADMDGRKIIFDQKGEYFNPIEKYRNEKIYYVFGPEGGLDKKEINQLPGADLCRLSENRLRSETAAIKAAGHFIL